MFKKTALFLLLSFTSLAYANSAQQESLWLQDYQNYQSALDFFKKPTRDELGKPKDDIALSYLEGKTQSNDGLVNQIRLKWMEWAIKETPQPLDNPIQANRFMREYHLLPDYQRTQNINCYRDLIAISTQKTVSLLRDSLAQGRDALPSACINLLASAIYSQSFDEMGVRKQIWRLLSLNRQSDASILAQALGQEKFQGQTVPLDGSDFANSAALWSIISPAKRNQKNVESRFNALIEQGLSADAIRFAHGILGYSLARDLSMPAAWEHFLQADPRDFSDEQWKWYARTALRQQNWQALQSLITQMPETLRNTPDWQYWYARASEQLGQKSIAQNTYRNVAQSGRNFYALMAQERLGQSINIKNSAPIVSNPRILSAQIAHALTLFRASLAQQNWDLRLAAGIQWREAVRNMNDEELIESASLAQQNQFYEMSIYAADRADRLLNFPLRYPAPYRDTVEQFSNIYQIDPAFAFGLIRQESRFMSVAQSRVGAGGLMQIMPATARYIAGKTGLSASNANEPTTNIQMGIWYLYDLYQQLGHPVLVTAGYNAGLSRARKWRTTLDVDADIYIETIPFDETRDYVKKVMANTAYYSALFGKPLHLHTHITKIKGQQ